MIKRFLLFLLGMFAVVVGILPTTTFSAIAAETATAYTSVLEDLGQDKDFDATLYPSVEKHYTLDVITVAESNNDELFVYVYQPSETETASSINLSYDPENVSTYRNFPLTLLSQDGVYQKYRVENFIVLCTDVRVYEISSIFRPFKEGVDTPPSGEGQTVSEVSYPVGKRFEFTMGEDGTSNMSLTDIELITVTDKFVGFTRYDEGWKNVRASDIHFVAFSTDKKMDDLLEVDIYYQQQHYDFYFHGVIVFDC